MVASAARPLKLNVPSMPPPPIYLAALAAPSIRLAGELADGWIPFLYPRELPPRTGWRSLREGASRSGVPDRPFAICPSVPTVVSSETSKARAGAAWFTCLLSHDHGFRSIVKPSRGADSLSEVEAVLAANSPRMLGVVPSAAERLLDELIVFGTPAEARERLDRWYAAGADTVSLLLQPDLTSEQIDLDLERVRRCRMARRARKEGVMADSDAAVTGRQRVAAAYKGGYADRVPAYPIAGSFAGCLDGLSIQEYCTNPTKATRAMLQLLRALSARYHDRLQRPRQGSGGSGLSREILRLRGAVHRPACAPRRQGQALRAWRFPIPSRMGGCRTFFSNARPCLPPRFPVGWGQSWSDRGPLRCCCEIRS